MEAFSADEFIESVTLNSGSARILSSGKLTCSAVVVSKTNSPPTSMANLQVINKSQKGD